MPLHQTIYATHRRVPGKDFTVCGGKISYDLVDTICPVTDDPQKVTCPTCKKWTPDDPKEAL